MITRRFNVNPVSIRDEAELARQCCGFYSWDSMLDNIDTHIFLKTKQE